MSRFSLPMRLLGLVGLLVVLYLVFELITSFLFGLFYLTLVILVVGGAALWYVVSREP